VIIDLIIMPLTFIFFFIGIKNTYWDYYVFSGSFYSIIKGIYGIFILINKIKYKIKPLYSKMRLLYLLPSFVLTLPHVLMIVIKTMDSLLKYQLENYMIIFYIFTMIILSIPIITGIIMWLINVLLYENNNKITLILFNIITPISMMYFTAMIIAEYIG